MQFHSRTPTKRGGLRPISRGQIVRRAYICCAGATATARGERVTRCVYHKHICVYILSIYVGYSAYVRSMATFLAINVSFAKGAAQTLHFNDGNYTSGGGATNAIRRELILRNCVVDNMDGGGVSRPATCGCNEEIE